MPSLAIGALLAAGAATVAASAAFTAGGFLLFSKAAAVFFAKRFLLVATLGYVIQKSAKKPSKPNAGGGQVRGSTQLAQDSVIPKRWILGRSRVTGAYIWHRHLDDRLAMVFVLGAGPMDSIERIWVDGEEVELTRGTGVNSNVLTPASGSRFNTPRTRYRTETYTEIVWRGQRDGGGDGPPDRSRRDGEDNNKGSLPGGPTDGGSYGPFITDGRDGRDGGNRRGGVRWGGNFPLVYASALDNPIASVYRGAVEWIGGAPDVRGQGEGGGRTRPGRYNAVRPGYARVTRTRQVAETYFVPAIKITEYFKADGTEGAAIRAIAAESLPSDTATETTRDNELAWTTNHRLNGVSYVLVEFTQPPHENTPDGVEGRFYNRLPTVEFQVKGLKVSYPVADPSMPNGRRMTVPEWTDNAAILRYWFLTERRYVDPLRIDLDYFTAARMKCAEPLSLATHPEYRDEYPASVPRYSINGVVNSGDSAQALERQFDLCWQGEAVQWNGGFMFRPGSEMTPRLVVREEDIIAEPVVRPTLPRERRSNEVSIVLEQNAEEDFRQAEFRIADEDRIAADNERLPADIGTQSFLNEPVQALNILYQALRAQTASMQVDIKVHPGDDFRYIGLVPGDKIELQLSEFGIGQGEAPAPGTPEAAAEVRYFRVASSSVNQDMSVDLRLTQWPDGWYEDRFEFPEIRPRTLLIPAPVAPPVGSPVVITHNILQDGGVAWEAVMYFEPTHHRTICYTESPLSNRQYAEVVAGEAHFQITSPGTYTFYAYNVSSDGRASNVISATALANYTSIPLPAPTVVSALPLGRYLQIQIQNIPDRDIAGAEVKFTRGALTADLTALPAITEDGWATAEEMNVTTSLPRSADQPIFANALFATTGSFRVFMRLVSRVDTLSPIVEVGRYRFELQGGVNSVVNSFPTWPGTAQNMLVWPHDGNNRLVPDPDILAADFTAWDGAPDWPFGSNDGFGAQFSSASTAYLTMPVTFDDATTSREVTVTVELDAPEGVANDVDDVVIQILRYTGPDATGSLSITNARDGVPATILSRSIRARVHLRDTQSNALVSLIVGYRDLS